MKTIYLIRHGEAESNTENVLYTENKLSKLTQNGMSQAQYLAETNPITFDIILSSPFKRAYDTARIINRDNVEIIVDHNLVEWLDCDADAQNPLTKDQRLIYQTQAWDGYDPYKTVHPKGESFASFWQRCDYVEKTLKAMTEKHIGVVSHAAFIRGLMFRSQSENKELSADTMKRFQQFLKHNKVFHACLDQNYILKYE